MGFLSVIFPGKKSLFQKVDNGIDQIKHGIYTRLSIRYIQEYGKDKASLLAAAVTNELFSLPPANEIGKEFFSAHFDIIEKELLALKEDEDIRKAVTEAIRIRMNIIYKSQKSGSYDQRLGDPYVKLVERGLAVSDHTDPTPKKFIRNAEMFYRLSIK